MAIDTQSNRAFSIPARKTAVFCFIINGSIWWNQLFCISKRQHQQQRSSTAGNKIDTRAHSFSVVKMLIKWTDFSPLCRCIERGNSQSSTDKFIITWNSLHKTDGPEPFPPFQSLAFSLYWSIKPKLTCWKLFGVKFCAIKQINVQLNLANGERSFEWLCKNNFYYGSFFAAVDRCVVFYYRVHTWHKT